MQCNSVHVSMKGFVGMVRTSLVLLFGMLLFVAPQVAVHAGPPASLTASQNPVVIATGQNVGQFTLAWNSGNGASVELYGSHNGGPEAGPYPAPAVGSSPESINYSETIAFKLYTPKKAQLLASLTVTTTRPDMNPPGGGDSQFCAQQCIKLIATDPHGTFTNFHVITTGPVKVIIEAHEDGKPVASSTFNLQQQQDWKTYLLNLTPNTKYVYNVKATDGSNNTQFSSGTFKTLRRQVQINFTDINVIDDSDTLSAGDLIFWFNVNGTWNQSLQFPSSGEAQIDSGTTVHPNHVETIIDAPDTLSLAVFGWDDDCDFFDGLCTHGIGPGGAANGSDSEADWATAGSKTTIALSGLGEAYTDSLSFSTTQFSLKFGVTATYTVSYVP